MLLFPTVEEDMKGNFFTQIPRKILPSRSIGPDFLFLQIFVK